MQPIVSKCYKFVNNNKQPQAIRTCVWCFAYKLLMLDPLAMKLGTLVCRNKHVYDDKQSETINT